MTQQHRIRALPNLRETGHAIRRQSGRKVTPAYELNGIKIYQGDALELLRLMPSGSVNCCVTSPPYWRLRDYGVEGQMGLEATPQEYVSKLVEVFSEVRRALRADGTLWLNIGDTYKRRNSGPICTRRRDTGNLSRARSGGCVNLKVKDIVGIPWMVAFALRADGWYLRSDIIWSKPNPMPESVTDRPTKSHEYIFLLSKNAKYYYDQEAILEPVSNNAHLRISQDLAAHIGSIRANTGGKTNGNMKAVLRQSQESWNGSRFTDRRDLTIRPDTGRNRRPKAWQADLGSNRILISGWKRKLGETRSGIKNNESFTYATCLPVQARNKRSVWTVNVQGFSEAHFATFPEQLIKPCILAGCPAGGTVLDPFFGAGTTGVVAAAQGCNCVGIELNLGYIEIARKRLKQGVLQFEVDRAQSN